MVLENSRPTETITEKKTHWEWTNNGESYFTRRIIMITKKVSLAYFAEDRDTVLAREANQIRLGITP